MEKRRGAGRSPTLSCSCKVSPLLTGHLHSRRNWPTWVFVALIIHPILRIWKTIESSPFFFRREGLCCHGDLVGRPNLSFFLFEYFKELEQRPKKCIEIRGEYVVWIPSLIAVVCFLPGRAKDLSAPFRNELPQSSW